MNFDMKIEQNCASFYDHLKKVFIVIDSFDNRNFNIRAGNLSKTNYICTVIANTDEELNKKLTEAVGKLIN